MKETSVLRRFIRANILFKKEEEEVETYAEILEGTRIHGYNLWILGFAMIIACVGLNTDSISAVIGAMLISPLMGPIVGFAYGLAINDSRLKKQAIRNWLFMTTISLFASILFFLVSPFGNNTMALASFTKASIFDILLAFFGGMAGFIGIVKKEGTKVIAGVAVATACMPPLCTAGFGLAHAQWSMLLGGLYFYLVNCLFIGLATFMLARFAGYHKKRKVEPFQQTANWLWVVFIVTMIVPSVIIAYNRWTEQQTIKQTLSDKERIERLEKRIEQLENKK
jgi:uncharacterized hydrophobic protein (TIGR00271 family)